MSHAAKPDWSPDLDSKPLIAVVFDSDIAAETIPWSKHVTMWQLCRMKGKPQVQVWMQWECADQRLCAAGWAELVASVPFDITPVQDLDEFNAGLDFKFTHDLAKEIASVQPVPRVISILLQSTAVGPLLRRVDDISTEDNTQKKNTMYICYSIVYYIMFCIYSILFYSILFYSIILYFDVLIFSSLLFCSVETIAKL